MLLTFFWCAFGKISIKGLIHLFKMFKIHKILQELCDRFVTEGVPSNEKKRLSYDV